MKKILLAVVAASAFLVWFAPVSLAVPLFNTTTASHSTTLTAAGTYDISVSCPTGYLVTGGGFAEDASSLASGTSMGIGKSTVNGNGWEIAGYAAAAMTVTVIAACGTIL